MRPTRFAVFLPVTLVSIMCAAWAALLITLAAPAHATPVSPVAAFFGGRTGAAAVLIAAAAAAQGGLRLHRTGPKWAVLLALLPQQFVLLVSAFGGISAAIAGHYADGTVRPWQFIVADQLPVFLLALIYSAALLALGAVPPPPPAPGP